MSHLSYTRGLPGLADIFLRDPSHYAPLLQFIERVMTRESEFTAAEREMIAAFVSKKNGCDFCLGVHRWTLSAMEIGWATIEALETGPDGEALSSKMKPVLRFAQKLTDNPEKVDQSDIDTLTAMGWSEQAVEDAINVIALFNYVNRLVDALGIDADEQYYKQIGKTLAQRGYAPLIETTLKKAS